MNPPAEPVSMCLSSIELVIFDFDGVIADSELLACSSLQRVLMRFGVEIGLEEVISRFLGRSSQAATAFLEERLGRRESQFGDVLSQELLAALERELRPVAGAVEFFRSPWRTPYHIASSSSLQRIRHSLKLIGLDELLAAHVTSAEEVARGKPFPDVFLRTARLRGVEPASCLVVEDSSAGIRAALAAGMQVVGMTAGSHMNPARVAVLLAAGSHGIVNSYAELALILQALRQATPSGTSAANL